MSLQAILLSIFPLTFVLSLILFSMLLSFNRAKKRSYPRYKGYPPQKDVPINLHQLIIRNDKITLRVFVVFTLLALGYLSLSAWYTGEVVLAEIQLSLGMLISGIPLGALRPILKLKAIYPYLSRKQIVNEVVNTSIMIVFTILIIYLLLAFQPITPQMIN